MKKITKLDTLFTRNGKSGKTVKTLNWIKDNNYFEVFCENNNYDKTKLNNFLEVANTIILEGDTSLLDKALETQTNLIALEKDLEFLTQS